MPPIPSAGVLSLGYVLRSAMSWPNVLIPTIVSGDGARATVCGDIYGAIERADRAFYLHDVIEYPILQNTHPALEKLYRQIRNLVHRKPPRMWSKITA